MNAVVESVRSLWLPLVNTNLLVPNVAIAEILDYQPLDLVEGGPDWLLGRLRWRDEELPVISIERLCGYSLPQGVRGARISIFNSVRAETNLPFFAMVTVGIPRLFNADADNLHAVAEHKSLDSATFGEVLQSANTGQPGCNRAPAEPQQCARCNVLVDCCRTGAATVGFCHGIPDRRDLHKVEIIEQADPDDACQHVEPDLERKSVDAGGAQYEYDDDRKYKSGDDGPQDRS